MSADLSIEITTAQLAKLTGVTSRRINQLTAEGKLVKARPGRYVLDDAITAYIAHQNETMARHGIRTTGSRQAPGSHSPDYEQARARLTAAKAESEELALEEKRGTLVPEKEHGEAIIELAAVFRGAVMSLPGRAAPVVISAESIPHAQELLDSYAREVLEELHQSEVRLTGGTSSDRAAVPQSVGGGEAAPEADGLGVGGPEPHPLEGDDSGGGPLED